MKPFPLVAGLLFLGTSTRAAPKPAKHPSIVRLSLAGVPIQNRLFARYDAAERCFLISSGDAGGASLDLILTPDPRVNWRYGLGNRQIEPAHLPNIRTGWGVNLGESPTQVQRKLGSAPHVVEKEAWANGTVWIYKSMVPSKIYPGKLQHYTARYIFRNGRLFAIHYNTSDPN